MLKSTLFRATIDIEGFPCKQLYKTANGTIFGDLNYFHVSLVEHGALKRKYHWLQHFKKICDDVPFLAGVQHLHTARRDTPAEHLAANVCTSLALVAFVWRSIDNARLQPMVDYCRDNLAVIAARACAVLPAVGGRLVLPGPGGHALDIGRNGQVSGFWDIPNSAHRNMLEAWLIMWCTMRGSGLLESDGVFGSRVSLNDIITFASFFRRTRRLNKQSVASPLASNVVDELFLALVSWLSVHFDKYILELHMPNNVNVDTAPPALHHKASENKRQYTEVSPEAIWELMDRSSLTGMSLRGAIKLRSDEATLGCSPTQCDHWTNKLQQMYSCRASLGFLNVKHFNIVADGSTHSCHDTLVSLAYTWENNLAAYLATQRIPPGKHMTWIDQSNMPPEIASLVARRKIERVAAFRQMQSISHQIHIITRGRLTLDSFKLDSAVHLQEVQPGEVRIVRPGADGMTDVAVIVGADKSFRQVLPDAVVDSLLLVVSLDQGSIGAAGMAFAINKLQLMLSTKFDKFHRIIRDIKLSIKHCSGGVFLKTQLFSAYLFGLNYKPFGAGGFSQLKNRLLVVFLATEDVTSEIWLKYCHRIADDFQMPCVTEEDHSNLWDAVASMPSFHQKLSFPKLGRWFSWNCCAKEHMREFSACKMLFEHHLGNPMDPDQAYTFDADRAALADASNKAKTPAEELSALKSATGGITLAYKLMSSGLQRHTKILYTVSQPCWTWYTNQVESVKTPTDGFGYCMRMADGRWAKEPHMWETIEHSLHDHNSLLFVGLPPGPPSLETNQIANKVLMLVWHTVAHRAWSLSKHCVPPECFANVASPDPADAERGMTSMRTAWKHLMMLEQRLYDLPAARQLWGDLDFAVAQPIRMLFVLFERDQWRAGSVAGRKLLNGLLCVLPDNKIVEDVHGAIRKESNANQNAKLSMSRIQDVVMRSRVFESRKISHPASLTKTAFCSKYKSTKFARLANNHTCAKHKMSGQWTTMWGNRTWKPLTEEGNHRSQAAWIWLHKCLGGEPGMSLKSALFSRLVVPFVLVACSSDARVYASMGNASWAALGWPVMQLGANEDGLESYAWKSGEQMEWFHVTNPSDYYVIPTVGERAAMGVAFKQTAARVPLMRYCALHHSSLLTHADLGMCATHLNLDVAEGASRVQLLAAIQLHFGDVFVAERKTPDAATDLVEDPLAEAVYDDMDNTEQMEFPEVHFGLKKRRERQRVAEWRALEKCGPPAKKRKSSVAKPKRLTRRRAAAAAPAAPDPAAPDHDHGLEVGEPEPAAPPVPEPAAPEPAAPMGAAPAHLIPPVDIVNDDAPRRVAAVAPQLAGSRRGRIGPTVPWENVVCTLCGQAAGQVKLEPNPGQRDGPTWHMRTMDPETQTWAVSGARHRSRRISVIGEDPQFAISWCKENRICCPQHLPA